MTEELNALPINWQWRKLGDFSNVLGGKRLPKGETFSIKKTDYPYIRVTDFDDFGVNLNNLKYLTEQAQDKIKKYTISKNDVYVSIAGSIGKVGIVPESLNNANLTENAAKITDIIGMDNKFLCLALNSTFGKGQMRKLTASTTQPKLALFKIRKILVPFPPLSEQKRIVEKVEALFSESKTTRLAISKIPFSLQQFRQSVLIKAFRGQLLKEVPNDGDSGKLLLERIRKIKSTVISGTGKIFVNQVERLYKIPDNWTWANADEICWKITDGEHNKPPTVPAGIPLLSAKNIRDGYLDFNDIDFVDENVAEKCLRRCNPELNDILIVCVGATIGRVSIVNTPKRFCLQRTVGILKPVKEEIMTEYLYYFLKSAASQNQINSFIRATAITHFNIDKMKKISIPVPSLIEQKSIVERINVLFNLANTIQKETETATEKINKIDEAVLAKAFRGELVPQDPNDEPASGFTPKNHR